jgi:cation diffusion facilitator CzcD-associated flavoprotein CzcO
MYLMEILMGCITELGCKRTIFDPGYLRSLHRPNLSLNWDGIDHFTSEGIVTKTGKEFKFDVVIFATGFEIVSALLISSLSY